MSTPHALQKLQNTFKEEEEEHVETEAVEGEEPTRKTTRNTPLNHFFVSLS